jgi:MFS family permease
LIVALAQNSTTIIVGRAIQGAGGAGITGGAYTICAFITQPKHLAPVMGLFGVVWSCSSVLGPVLGGIFTQDVSWRWCFWINLPIGGATMLIILIFFKTPAWSRMASTTPKEIPLAFDFPGMAIFLGAFVCIFLVLQDGGISRSWSSSVVIGLFVGFGLLLIVFSIIEWKQGERAMIVGRIQKRRSILACSVFTFL